MKKRSLYILNPIYPSLSVLLFLFTSGYLKIHPDTIPSEIIFLLPYVISLIVGLLAENKKKHGTVKLTCSATLWALPTLFFVIHFLTTHGDPDQYKGTFFISYMLTISGIVPALGLAGAWMILAKPKR